MQTTTQTIPREALDVDFRHTSMIINWKDRDYFWLSYFKKYCNKFPDDYLSKLVYKNYLRWYRNN